MQGAEPWLIIFKYQMIKKFGSWYLIFLKRRSGLQVRYGPCTHFAMD